MKSLQLKALVPQYMQTFQCLGAECPENCCHGWRVDIDQHTYNQYRQIAIYPLAEKLNAVVHPVETPSRGKFAVMQMQDDGNCAMLDKTGLCEIQSRLGAEYLSDTCMHYPRVFSLVNDQARCFATMSCPAVAAALGDPDSMAAAQMEMTIPGKSEVPLENIVDLRQHPVMVVEFLEPIYEVACMVLRQPELTATDAMVVLSLMMQRILRHFADPDPAAARAGLAQTLTDFCRPAYCVEVKNAMAQAPRQTAVKIALLKGITVKYLHESKGRPSFLEVLAQVARGLHFEAADLAESEQRYLDAEQNWFEPFDSAHRHLLKNYLLNDLGKNNFPTGKSLDIEAEFTSLAVRFALIKLYLTGIAAVQKETFGEQDYVRLIYTFVRNLEHGSFFPDTLAAMEQQGYSNLAAAVVMLR